MTTAAAIFKARFVDFVGVEEFKESELGPIPKGWDVVPFSEAIELNPRVRITKGDDAPYIEMAALPSWGTRSDRMGSREFKGGSKFERNDTIMARITGCIEHGKGAFLDFIESPTAGSTEFIVMRAKTTTLTPEAVFLFSRLDRVRDHAIQNMSGSSGRQRVPSGCFDQIDIAIPRSVEEWNSEAQALRALFATTLELWRENRTLTSIRGELLPKLISGKIRVSEGVGLGSDPDEVLDELGAESVEEKIEPGEGALVQAG